MEYYGEDLRALQQKISLKRQLDAKLSDLQEQRKVFDRKVIQLRVAYRSEQEDVEKLEGRSLANYFYNVIGKLDDKLDAERQEAYAARVKLDAAERELMAVDRELEILRKQCGELLGIEQVYQAELAKKRQALKTAGTPAGTEILELEEAIAFLKSQKKELSEAAAAGRKALSIADRVLSELDDADGWNTWDMLGGGGLITHMAKHGHLDDAQSLVEELQGQLRQFKTELADINVQANLQVNIDGFLRFADYFFDGLFADWAVGDRISESQSSVLKVKHQIEKMLGKIEQMEAAAVREIADLTAKIEACVVQG